MSVTRGQCDVRSMITFPARHHRPLAGTKLYCLTCQLTCPWVALDSRVTRIQNCELLISSPVPYRYATKPHTASVQTYSLRSTNGEKNFKLNNSYKHIKPVPCTKKCPPLHHRNNNNRFSASQEVQRNGSTKNMK